MLNEIINKLSPKVRQILELADKKKYVGDTAELVGVTLKFKDISKDDFIKLSPYLFDLQQAEEIVDEILIRNGTVSGRSIGVYNLSYYHSMSESFKALRKYAGMLRAYMDNEMDKTRQLSITFDHLHCFQFMQFVKRGNTGYINVGMRSCNINDNFLTDLFLSFTAGKYIMYDVEKININMFIGSLHLFKKDATEFADKVSRLGRC